MNISNEKLVLWGHIIVLSIILLVGFGMVFNYISYAPLSKIDSSSSSIKEGKNSIVKLPGDFDICYTNTSYNNDCIKDISLAIAKENKDSSYCTFISDVYARGDCIESIKKEKSMSYFTNESIIFDNEFCSLDNTCDSFIPDFFKKNLSVSCSYLDSEEMVNDCFSIYLEEYNLDEKDFCYYFSTEIFQNYCLNNISRGEI